ncbi:hypothetical protein ACFWA9_34645 [Kitasatospora sp. NPDC059973]|uniref:hypothetical protein n=1 Tax=Kitasatospora sp. NPDC059973 TaxID=3347020 RepID=UPI0036B17F29
MRVLLDGRRARLPDAAALRRPYSDFQVGPDRSVFVEAGDRLSYEEGDIVSPAPAVGGSYRICR